MTSFPDTLKSWQALGQVDPKDLADARQQLHWAAQIPSAVGTTLIPPRADDSQTNLEWMRDPAVLAGELVDGAMRLRGALEPATMRLHLIDHQGKRLASLPLTGTTYIEGMSWMQSQIELAFGSRLSKPLKRRELEIPEHATGENSSSPFSAPEEKLRELSLWFANADLLQQELAAQLPGASPVRCWPHHFDHAMLLSLEPGGGYEGRSVGIGLVPGDDFYREPYWYVNPYPAPAGVRLPALAAGHWHTDRWTGAVLPATEIVAKPGTEQAQICIAYLASALDACRTVVGAKA